MIMVISRMESLTDTMQESFDALFPPDAVGSQLSGQAFEFSNINMAGYDMRSQEILWQGGPSYPTQ